MQKRKPFAIALALILIFLCLSGNGFVMAETAIGEETQIPFSTYTYWSTGTETKRVNCKPMFDVGQVYDSEKLHVKPYKSLTDVSVAHDGWVFLLDGSQSRVTVLDETMHVVREFYTVGEYSFSKAQGIFAYGDDTVYIADTENARVLVASRSGECKKVITLPKTDLIADDFIYRPIKVAVDHCGYMYVLSDGSYQGAILYSPKGEFLSFFGANSVTGGITEVFSAIWNKLTMTNAKRSGIESRLPYQFTDLYVDADNFVYTATGKTKENQLQSSVIKMLSPQGNNILPSEDTTFGENVLAQSGSPSFEIGSQNMAGLAVDSYGFIYVYDTTYSRIYVYDSQCQMFCAFGAGYNIGKQKGTFQGISSMDVKGNDLLVTDGVKNTLTVFTCNEYGLKVKTLQKMTLDGDYSKAKQGWETVNRLDKNNRFSYIGLAKAAYAEGEYQSAMSYAEIAGDKDTYAMAFQKQRTAWLRSYAGWFLAALLVFVCGIAFIVKKRSGHGIKNRKTALYFGVLFHPIASFTEIKYKKDGSVLLGMVSLVLLYISLSTQSVFGSFVFVSSDAGSFNSVLLIVKTFGLVALWVITNWGVCTLMGGIGRIKEIFVVISYSLFPLILGNILTTVVTHILVPSEAMFLSVVMTVLTLWFVFLVIVGTMIVHDFSFGKFIGSSVLTVLGMAVVLFVAISVVILVQQFAAFLGTVFNEMIYR